MFSSFSFPSLSNVNALELKQKNVLEGFVIKWTYQINDILIMKPKLQNPTSNKRQLNCIVYPTDEYEYWNTRYQNLYKIYQQLTNQHIKCIGEILQTINSVYFQSFKKIFQNTVQELNKAGDIKIYITALHPFIEVFRINEFDKFDGLIRPMLKSMSLMWAHCHFYTSSDWIRLFGAIGNMLMRESNKYLDAASLFQGDADDKLNKIETSASILNYFK